MFPKTTVVILLYSYTTTSSDLLDLNFILLERIFKFSEWLTKNILLEQKR
jgi:hypothetical protein